MDDGWMGDVWMDGWMMDGWMMDGWMDVEGASPMTISADQAQQYGRAVSE